MLAAILAEGLTAIERSQLDRKQEARKLWAEGRPEGALLVLDAVLSESMTDRVAVECYVTKAAFLAEVGDFEGSTRWIDRAGPLLDLASPRVQGSFYNQRARIRRKSGRLDDALTDYTGAAFCWQSCGSRDLEGSAYLNIAEVNLIVGDLESARSNLGRAFEIFNEHAPSYLSQAYDTLANIELADGRLPRAMSAIEKAFDLVGDNEAWRKTFSETKAKIDALLLELLRVTSVDDLDHLKAVLVQTALMKTAGNLSKSGKLLGLTYKGVDYIIQQHPELERFRTERKRRLKSVIKKSR